MSKILVLLTLKYPDPLMDKELPFLANAFDKIYLLPQDLTGNPQVPPNVKIYSIFKRIELDKPLPLLVKHFFRIVRIYGTVILKSAYRGHYFKYIKSFLGHLLLELEKIKPLEEFVRAHQLQSALYYDYWLVDSTLALAELKRKRLIKYSIARAHGFDLYHDRQFEEHVSFQEYRISQLDRIYTISNHGFDYLHSKLPAGLHEKIKLNYLGVLPRQVELRQKIEVETFTIVSCSSIIASKRLGLLVDVLQQSTLTIHWIHFGDGILMNEILGRVAHLPKNIRVEFKGNQPNAKVLEFYESKYVDLFISLSEYEGLPVSMMEAIQFGIPVMACAIYGVPEIVTPKTGVLVEVDAQVDRIRKVLELTLLTHPFDRAEIQLFFEDRFNEEKNFNLFIGDISVLFPMTSSPTPVWL